MAALVNTVGKRVSLDEWKSRLYRTLISLPANRWMGDDPPLDRALRVIVDSFNEEACTLMRGKEQIVFFPSEGVLGAAFSATDKYHVVIVYPDLLRMLKSGASTTAMAILAHELGHIAFDHSNRSLSNLEAQVEADNFAFLLGFGEELQDFLMDYGHSVDVRVRIARLTALMIPTLG